MTYRHMQVPLPAEWNEEHRAFAVAVLRAMEPVDAALSTRINVLAALAVGMIVAGAAPGQTEEDICNTVGMLVSTRLHYALGTRAFATDEVRPVQ